MFGDLEARIDGLINDLLRGKRLRLGARDAADRGAIMAAAELVAAREGYPRMSPAFRRRLAAAIARGDAGDGVTRRTALGAVAGLAAGAVGAAAFSRLGSGGAAAAVAGGVMRSGAGSWVPVATMSQLSEEQPTRVVAGDLVAFLFRDGHRVTGVSGVCTHWACVLDWKAAERTLNCPCHEVEFNPDGRPLTPSYEVPPLPAVQVRVEGDQVLVYSP